MENINELKTTDEWRLIDWRKLERRVFRLQKRIYRASLRGDLKQVHSLQRLLMSSWSAKCRAVRRVTQDNRGKKTAGVDGVQSLEPQERLELVKSLTLEPEKVKPIRREEIPKKGTDEKRPLGIPVMRDRAVQALVKLALEPEWEARFEPNSYGFRPGRSCHDAMSQIYVSINKMDKYVLDADIAKCFDRIAHAPLLDKLSQGTTVRRLIKAWLKAGVMRGKKLFPTKEGTPQGGVISPLLANIALHGLENHIRDNVKTRKPGELLLVRYADDFVIAHKSLDKVLEAKKLVEEWLRDMSLELKESKTRIVHTYKSLDGEKPGFNFLGWNFRQYDVDKCLRGTRGLPFKTIIKPSKESVKEHVRKIRETLKELTKAPEDRVVMTLNPMIRGWCNYHSAVCSKETFEKVSSDVFQMLMAWVKRRHGRRDLKRLARHYWGVNNGWRFAVTDETGQKRSLLSHQEFEIKRHIKVAGNRSPYDGDMVYWATRLGTHPEMNPRKAWLMKRQKGKCDYCKMYFREEDVLETHHRDGNHKNNSKNNLCLIHGHCHDKAHGSSASDVLG